MDTLNVPFFWTHFCFILILWQRNGMDEKAESNGNQIKSLFTVNQIIVYCMDTLFY